MPTAAARSDSLAPIAMAVGQASTGAAVDPAPRSDRHATRPAAHTLPHRADIEGLRGIAVLAVLAVHAFPNGLTGGYVGVDIFFVLSGFLIATLIDRDLAAGRFSLLDFYQRRARRLLPALCTVLLACLLVGAFATWPADARQIGQHVGAGALFASNLALWLESGYFDASSELKPLLHLWSLGIEEQFYLLWPLAAWALQRVRARSAGPAGGKASAHSGSDRDTDAGERRAWAWLIGALLASLALNLAFVASKPVATFFLLPTRAWELMLGAVLARLALDGADPLQRLHRWITPTLTPLCARFGWAPPGLRRTGDASAALGLLLIAIAMATLDRHAPYPGAWALLPTLGTVAILAAGPGAWLNRIVLGHRVLRFYGAISYPLYLWHWPLLVFPLLLGLEMTLAARVGMLCASVALAALTVELIETPLRHGRPGPLIPAALVATLAMIGAGGWALHHSNGRLQAYPPEIQAIAQIEFGFDYRLYRAGRCMLDLEQGPESFTADCAAQQPGGLLVWGDSHAASLYPGLLRVSQGTPKASSIAQYTKARCPPVANPPAGASKRCEQIHAAVLKQIAQQRPRTVVLAGAWALYGDSVWPSLRRTLADLESLGVERIVVLGPLPTWTQPLPRVLLEAWRDTGHVPTFSARGLQPGLRRIERSIEKTILDTRAIHLSALDAACPSGRCTVSAHTPEGPEPMAFDESHLTAAGSVFLVQHLSLDVPTN